MAPIVNITVTAPASQDRCSVGGGNAARTINAAATDTIATANPPTSGVTLA